MTPILQVNDLCYTYAEGTPFRHDALHGVSFSLQRGEFLGVIGRTGSGKSTLIQHLNGLLKPSSGTVLFDGRDIWEDKQFTRSIRFRVGLVFQYPEYQLFEETVYDDIAFGPKNMGLDKEEIDRRVRRAASFAGIREENLSRSPFDLSGGQKRRAAIAGVIAMEPDVLVLDEPTAGLDPMGQQKILENVRAYQRSQNAAVIMVSHSMEDVAACADRLLVLSEGESVMTGTPHEVFSHPEELRAVGLDVPEITKVFLRLRELGLDVDPAVYTVEQAKAAILARRGEARP